MYLPVSTVVPALLVIENVGNLVCPAAFDLGENQKVALLSTPEGEDKPLKYPLLFHEASLILITKMDLVPYLDWNLELCEQYIRRVNFSAPILRGKRAPLLSYRAQLSLFHP